jgi:DNA topoisomerase VI subunit B
LERNYKTETLSPEQERKKEMERKRELLYSKFDLDEKVAETRESTYKNRLEAKLKKAKDQIKPHKQSIKIQYMANLLQSHILQQQIEEELNKEKAKLADEYLTVIMDKPVSKNNALKKKKSMVNFVL